MLACNKENKLMLPNYAGSGGTLHQPLYDLRKLQLIQREIELCRGKSRTDNHKMTTLLVDRICDILGLDYLEA